jgi:putative oxidoreductase
LGCAADRVTSLRLARSRPSGAAPEASVIDRIKLLLPQPDGGAVHTALLALRVIAGAAFIQHGQSKIKNPFGWMGPDSGMPGFLQALAAIAEFGGGIAWILGALTPLASLGLVATMIVAAAKHIGRGDPFVSKGGGGSYEPALLFRGIALVLMVAGPGKYSVDGFLRSRILSRKGPRHEA